MIKSVVSFINNVTRKFFISPSSIVEGRQYTSLAKKLQAHYLADRKEFLQQQAFRIKISNMGATEAKLQTLKRDWHRQTTDMTVQQYGRTVEKLEDQIQQERQAKGRKLGHI